ncbi:xibalbin-1-like [Tachypleus tridentatus]|uniref:xibalbin-1-like n=1 Tax=Tachypleus tridentatus TaxID=6853 RepID=UPI003FD05527
MNCVVFSLIFGVIFLADSITATPYDFNEDNKLEEYRERLQEVLPYAEKRSCIPRSGSCDNRPYSCCGGSSCRCNLWGTNCRCQRQGLFQGWGK